MRVDISVPASHMRFDNKGWVRQLATCRSMNISYGGVRLKSNFPVDLREMLQVRMVLRPTILTFTGKVAYVRPRKDKSLEFGVRIEKISDQDRITLQRFIARKSKERAKACQ